MDELQTNPNISIITNFGCKSGCWYCVWKTHPLKDVKLETDWDKLYTFLETYKDKKKFSISGGGDCLNEYSKYKEWWDKIFEISRNLDMLVDVHSRERLYETSFWSKVNRCVVSSDVPNDCFAYLLWLRYFTKIRIVHVITHMTTEDMFNTYIDHSKYFKCQLTFKKLVGHDDKYKYEYFKNKYPEQFFLDEGDYNIYYMPDNTIQSKFLSY